MNASVLEGRLCVSVREIQQATGYSERYIYKAIAEKQLRAIRKGRSVRVMVPDLLAWLQEGAE